MSTSSSRSSISGTNPMSQLDTPKKTKKTNGKANGKIAVVAAAKPSPRPPERKLFGTDGMRADAGIVISASHNPYQDNGIKIFGDDGFKLADETEAEIERLMETDALVRPTGPGIGKASRLDDAGGRYIVFAKATFPRGLTL